MSGKEPSRSAGLVGVKERMGGRRRGAVNGLILSKKGAQCRTRSRFCEKRKGDLPGGGRIINYVSNSKRGKSRFHYNVTYKEKKKGMAGSVRGQDHNPAGVGGNQQRTARKVIKDDETIEQERRSDALDLCKSGKKTRFSKQGR